MARKSLPALPSLLISFICSPAIAQSSTALTDPSAFAIAYGMSFLEYDTCGDGEAGRLARQAIVERFEQCPFTPGAKAGFQSWRIDQLEKLASELFQMLELGQRPNPANLGEFNPDGTPMNCSGHRKTSRYIAHRAELIRYGRGEIKVEELLPDRCDVSPVAP